MSYAEDVNSVQCTSALCVLLTTIAKIGAKNMKEKRKEINMLVLQAKQKRYMHKKVLSIRCDQAELSIRPARLG